MGFLNDLIDHFKMLEKVLPMEPEEFCKWYEEYCGVEPGFLSPDHVDSVKIHMAETAAMIAVTGLEVLTKCLATV